MDILSQAKSGMGKTAVFVLATLQQIEPVDGQVGARKLAFILNEETFVISLESSLNEERFFSIFCL